jgi:2-dehydro-3-deoxygluconokinase
MIQLDNGERSFCYWRGQSAAKQLALDPKGLDRAISDSDLIYFSGISLAILDAPSRETLFAALRKGRGNGKKIAFDTNLRPKLWASAQEMTQTVMLAAALSDIVLPSHEDEAEWFGDLSPQTTRERYAQLGVDQVIVKNSEHSVLFQDGQLRGEVAVEPAPAVVDTTAAGDSFNAGVLAGLLVQNDLAAGISDGCILAGQVVGHRGALFEEAKTR